MLVMEVDKVADEVTNMEVDKVTRHSKSVKISTSTLFAPKK